MRLVDGRLKCKMGAARVEGYIKDVMLRYTAMTTPPELTPDPGSLASRRHGSATTALTVAGGWVVEGIPRSCAGPAHEPPSGWSSFSRPRFATRIRARPTAQP